MKTQLTAIALIFVAIGVAAWLMPVQPNPTLKLASIQTDNKKVFAIHPEQGANIFVEQAQPGDAKIMSASIRLMASGAFVEQTQ